MEFNKEIMGIDIEELNKFIEENKEKILVVQDLNPGDNLIVYIPEDSSVDYAESVARYIEQILPMGVGALVLPSSIKVEKLTIRANETDS